MAYMRIYCGDCGGTWEIYGRDDWKNDKARECPHCFSKIGRHTWEKQVIPAFAAVSDANRELYKDSTGYNKPLFTINIIADHVNQNTWRGIEK